MGGKKTNKKENSKPILYRLIAPPDKIKKEYNSLLKEVDLRTDEETRRLLLMNSFVGRAQCGNGRYCKEEYVNTSMDNLVAIKDEIIRYWKLKKGMQPQEIREFVKQKNQEKIDAVYTWVKEVLKGKKLTKLVDKNGKPLFGVENLSEWQIKNPADVLKGIYYASRMDNYEWRKKVNEVYGTDLGGGSCYAIDFQKMHELGLDFKNLSRSEWSQEQIMELKRKKLIIEGDEVKTDDRIRLAYVREKIGIGVSDDLALIIAGMWHGSDALLGSFLADAIDTWDKYTPHVCTGGLDERLGDLIEKDFDSSQLPSEDDVVRFIYSARRRQDISLKIPDNSQRYLLQIDKCLDQTALESHYKFVAGQDYELMVLGYVGCKATNEELYDYVGRVLKKTTHF